MAHPLPASFRRTQRTRWRCNSVGVGGRDGSRRQRRRRAQGSARRCAVVNAGAGQMRKDSVGERVKEGGEQIGFVVGGVVRVRGQTGPGGPGEAPRAGDGVCLGEAARAIQPRAGTDHTATKFDTLK